MQQPASGGITEQQGQEREQFGQPQNFYDELPAPSQVHFQEGRLLKAGTICHASVLNAGAVRAGIGPSGTEVGGILPGPQRILRQPHQQAQPQVLPVVACHC